MKQGLVFQSECKSKTCKSTLHSTVLCTTLFLTATIPSPYYSAIFFILLLTYIGSYNVKIDNEFRYVLNPLIGMILCGAFFCINNDLYDSIRDAWYAAKALICLLMGYYLGRKITNQHIFFNILVYISSALSLVYLSTLFIAEGQLDLESVSAIGGMPIFVAVAIPLLLFSNTGFVFKGNQVLRLLLILAISAAFIFSYSRTGIVALIIFIASGMGLFNNLRKVLYLLILAAFLFFAISNYLPQIEVGNISFFGKLQNSLVELSFNDGSDRAEMITNWRGFEAYRAFIGFEDAQLLQQVFGQGWGANVDLGFSVEIGKDMNYQYLPILHNGYMHILTKYGLIGLGLYVLFLWRVIHKNSNIAIAFSFLRVEWLILGIGYLLVYTTLVISGIFNKSGLDSILILLGFAYGTTSFARLSKPVLKKNE